MSFIGAKQGDKIGGKAGKQDRRQHAFKQLLQRADRAVCAVAVVQRRRKDKKYADQRENHTKTPPEMRVIGMEFRHGLHLLLGNLRIVYHFGEK